MGPIPSSLRALMSVYLWHLGLAPLVWLAQSSIAPRLELGDLPYYAPYAWALGAWVHSCVVVGKPLNPFALFLALWSVSRGPLGSSWEWLKEESQKKARWCVSPVLFAALDGLRSDPALWWLGIDLVLLTAALVRAGAMGKLITGTPAWSARDAVEAFYDGHRKALRGEYPTGRLRADLRTRIPEDMPENEAWAAAKEMVAELQDAAARGAKSLKKKAAETAGPDPERARAAELAAKVEQAESEVRATQEELRRQRSAGMNTAWIERGLAAAERARDEAAAELEALHRARPDLAP
jgi:hypothetical protein